MDHELKANHGVYGVWNGVCHISYGKKFHKETKLKIITAYDDDDLLANFIVDSLIDHKPYLDYEKKSTLFSFREVKRMYEMVGLKALMTIGTDLEPVYWEHWLRLDDGTILNPRETQEYFSTHGGINTYIAKDPFRAKTKGTERLLL